MSAADSAEALCRDLPAGLEVHLHQIDLVQDRVLLVRLRAQDLAQASFLDQRVTDGARASGWYPWSRIAERMHGQAKPAPAHYLFHIGHCGSTLLSRLLAEAGVTPLREPLPLRTLAELHADLDAPHCRWSRSTFEARLALVLGLYDRGTGLRAVKPTSYCNDLAAAMLGASPASRATACFVRPWAHIANLLAGPASRLDLLAMAPLRLRRLEARVGGGSGRLCEMSPGVVAAMSWATETAALAAALDAAGEARLKCVDFDEFLEDVPASLRALARHVDAGIAAERVEAAAASAALRQYSKAPEHPYDAALRGRLLSAARAQFGAEIRAGLDWCERAAARFPPVARAVERFGGGLSSGPA